MARGDRNCLICSKKYTYCPNCQDTKPNETWKALYCSQACRTVFDILSKFVNGHMTADIAYEKLSALEVDKMRLNEQFKENWEQIKKQHADKEKSFQNQSYVPKKVENFKKK